MFYICVCQLLLFPINVTITGGIIVALIDCYILYLVQDYIELGLGYKQLQKELDALIYSTEIYNMSENDLRQFGASKGLSETQQDILVDRVIEHLKISEICKYKHYGRTTIKYHIAEIKRKLNIDKI